MTFLYLPELKRWINLATVDSVIEGKVESSGEPFFNVFNIHGGMTKVTKPADIDVLLSAIGEYEFERPKPKSKGNKTDDNKGSDTPPI